MPPDGDIRDYTVETEPARILREARQGIVPERGALDASKMTPRERAHFLSAYLRTPVVEQCWTFESWLSTNPKCGTPGCAAGHWLYLVGERSAIKDVIYNEAVLGFTENDCLKLFCLTEDRACGYDGRPAYQITPTDVADAIDALLSRRES